MATGMPELGSKISLISKADIRYEGRLFTVDPQECTIALASVRSFGTEDRETQYPVPAQNQVYDYILFRGSDIKDIRVVNNVPHPQPLNDPAIMQLSVPPSLGGQTFQSHPVLGPMGPQLGQFGGGTYGGLGAMGTALSSGTMGPSLGMQRDGRGLNAKPSELIGGNQPPPSVIAPPPVDQPKVANDHASVLDLIGGGSRSTTPASAGSRKSPTTDQSCQTGSAGGKKSTGVRPIQPPGAGAGGQRNQQNRRRSRERRDSRGDGTNAQIRTPAHRGQQGNQNHQPATHNQQGYYNQGYNHYQGGYQGGQQNRGGGGGNWNHRGQTRARGRPRGGGGFRPNNHQGAQQGNAHLKAKNTLKFDSEYDFEQANTEFEELRSQLGKLKLDEPANGAPAAPRPEPALNGDADKKDDSGNETGAGEPEHEEEPEVYYDKSKSFFDKISCEAVERAKGKSQRTDWRVERKLNSETFGVAAARRGGYRGRGYRGMMYRGGYRSGYNRQPRRDQQNYNNINSSQPANQQQQQGTTRNNADAKEPGEKLENISDSSVEAPEWSDSSKQNSEPVVAVK